MVAAGSGRTMLTGWTLEGVQTRHRERGLGQRLVVVAVGREGNKRSVVAAGSGRAVAAGWTLEEGQPRHRQRRPGQRLVAVAAAVDREGSKRSGVAAAGVMVVQPRRWIGMEPMMGAEGPVGRR